MNHKIKNIIFFAILLLVASIIPTAAKAAKNTTSCSLQLVSTPSSSNIPPGGTVSYQYALKNIGTAACAGASVSLYYADNEAYVSAAPAPSASNYYWNVGKLAIGQTYNFSVNIKNIPDDNTQIFGEACASANGVSDSCASQAVGLVAAPAPIISPVTTPITPVAPAPIAAATDTQAWIYPGDPACNAANEYSDGRQIDTLKPEYYTVQTGGTLRQRTVAVDGCNAYSAANAADVKAHSNHQYVTVSGDIANTHKLLASASLQSSAITTLTNFAVSSGFTGVELDWEGFGDWTVADYANYKKFVNALQTSLHAKGKLLMIDAPAISDPTYQGYFLFKYEDFTNIDYVAIMAYDYEYDYGVGAPVAPLAWVENIINWAKARLDVNKIIIGIPAYGYHGTLGSYDINIDTYAQSASYPGFSSRTVNADSEESWIVGNTYYVDQAASGLNLKKSLIESMGIKNVSIWHLGGNQWFSKS
jgi:spore germination protein YaaH